MVILLFMYNVTVPHWIIIAYIGIHTLNYIVHEEAMDLKNGFVYHHSLEVRSCNFKLFKNR